MALVRHEATVLDIDAGAVWSWHVTRYVGTAVNGAGQHQLPRLTISHRYGMAVAGHSITDRDCASHVTAAKPAGVPLTWGDVAYCKVKGLGKV